MAELLIFMENRDAGSPEATSKFAQRGDVISAQHDGWPWGDMERDNPRMAIIIVPDAVPADFASLLSHEVPQPGNETDYFGLMSNTLQFRGFYVDVDSYVGGVLRAGADATIPKDDVLALKLPRAPLPDTRVIGRSDRIIG